MAMILLPALVVQSANAQNAANRNSIAKTKGCLSHMDEQNYSPKSCIGEITRQCLRNNGEQPNIRLKCIGQEALIWSSLLKEYSFSLAKLLDEEGKTSYSNSSSSWEQYQTEACSIYVLLESSEEGEIRRSDCKMEHIAERAIEVRAYLKVISQRPSQ